MNPESPDHPDLTAYALGELSHEQEREMRAWLEGEPQILKELSGIEQISAALHQGSPIPSERLSPQQRQRVLTPPRGPRIITPMMPRQPAQRQESRFMPLIASTLKIAAVTTLTTGAFMLGRQVELPRANESNIADIAKPDTKPSAPSQIEAAKVQQVAVSAPEVKKEKVKPTEQPQPTLVTVTAPIAAPETKLVEPAELIKSEATPKPKIVATNTSGFTPTGRTATSRVDLRPFETRPVPVKNTGVALSSPMTHAAPSGSKAADKGKSPDLMIHSWKAEFASCPWNPDNRLMRVLVQLPADQPASTSPANIYPLQITFDTLTVRSYRLLSESHVPPEAGNNSAAHVMWYEVVPNGAAPEQSRETGRSVATVTLPNARFISQTVGPFDSSKLRALDRGQSWENARDDFVFETAIVGFGLLLRGEENLGNLNHELVLRLAEKAQGNAAKNDERTKFIKLVQEARRVTGI